MQFCGEKPNSHELRQRSRRNLHQLQQTQKSRLRRNRPLRPREKRPKNQGNPRHNHNQLQQILRSKKEAKHKSPCIMNYKPVSFTSCLGKSLQTSTTVLLLLPTIKSAPRFYVRSDCLSFFPNHSSNQQNWCITVVNYGSSQRKAFGWLLHVIE